MTPSATRALGSAKALLLAAGCTLFDTGTRVRLEPEGRVYTQGRVAIRIHASDRTQARLVLDGRLLDGDYPVGVDVTIDLETEADGVHRVAARVYDGERARDSNALEVVVDRLPPTYTVAPAPGEYLSLAPFSVAITFSEPVEPASVGPDTVRLVSDPAPGTVVPATVALAGDARSATVSASARLDQIGPVHLEVAVRDLVGHPNDAPQWAPAWAPPHLFDRLIAETNPMCGFTLGAWAGAIDIVSWRYDARAQFVEVLVDGTPIGRFSPTQTRVTWDTRLFPDGAHQIGFGSPGFVGFDWLTLVVDNTPPSVVACSPHLHALDDASVMAGVDVVLSEPVCRGQILQSGCGGQCLAGMADRIVVTPQAEAGTRITPPFTWTFTLPEVVDAAGHPVAASPACTVTFPAWLKPWGSAALDDGSGAPFGPAAFRLLVGLEDAGSAELVRVATAAASLPGAVEVMRSIAPGPWVADPAPLNGTPFAPATQLRSSGGNATVWLEVDGAGGQRIRAALRYEGTVETVASIDASAGLVEIGNPLSSVAWIQGSATGTREVLVARRTPGAGWTVAPPANVDAAADASDPTLGEGLRARVAFVESAPGGVPQLRVRELQDDGLTWISLGDVLNRDPAVAAQEPWLGSDEWQATVTWVEGGQVLARRGDWVGTWGQPAVLNADPAAPARAPRFQNGYPTRIVFIEGGVGGDRFEVREWDEWSGSWRPLASLPAGGQVASFAIYQSPLAIAWTDTAGDTWLRVYNSDY